MRRRLTARLMKAQAMSWISTAAISSREPAPPPACRVGSAGPAGRERVTIGAGSPEEDKR